ncbi:hypothetical protein EMIHUDRAFT_45247, partial [Emiliania huxleyi CCMP1516]|uniref:Uncharacterized protein n=2 Tax=Emiliania huxleyi TaxID=2903 RepID=A0A0D3KKG2_EMIH1
CCNDEQTFFIVTFSCYVAAVGLVWRSPVFKPFKLWTTLMHEFSHACGAWLTCNKVTGIEVHWNEGGLTHWQGDTRRMTMSKHVVLPAGYLGSTLWGVLTILSVSNYGWARVTGCVMLTACVICLAYAIFGKSNEERTPLIACCIAFGALLGTTTVLSYVMGGDPGSHNHIWDLLLYSVLLFVGTLNAMYATVDIYDDTISRT